MVAPSDDVRYTGRRQIKQTLTVGYLVGRRALD